MTRATERGRGGTEGGDERKEGGRAKGREVGYRAAREGACACANMHVCVCMGAGERCCIDGIYSMMMMGVGERGGRKGGREKGRGGWVGGREGGGGGGGEWKGRSEGDKSGEGDGGGPGATEGVAR